MVDASDSDRPQGLDNQPDYVPVGRTSRSGLSPYNMRSPLKALFTWKGTVLPLVSCTFEAWFFVGMHTVFLLAINSGFVHVDTFYIGEEPWKMLALPTGMLTFFIVFLMNQCYTRFVHLYEESTYVMGTLQVIGALSSVHLKDHDARWHAVPS